MTTALCMFCGETKFGAFCPYPACESPATGDPNLDIMFSDHRMPVSNLQQFGDIIRAINAECDDLDTRFWSFITHVSKHYDEVLSASEQLRSMDQLSAFIVHDLKTVNAQLVSQFIKIGINRLLECRADIDPAVPASLPVAKRLGMVRQEILPG